MSNEVEVAEFKLKCLKFVLDNSVPEKPDQLPKIDTYIIEAQKIYDFTRQWSDNNMYYTPPQKKSTAITLDANPIIPFESGNSFLDTTGVNA